MLRPPSVFVVKFLHFLSFQILPLLFVTRHKVLMIPPGYAVAVAPSVLVAVGLLSQHGNAGMAVHKNSCFDIKNTCSHNNNLHIFFR